MAESDDFNPLGNNPFVRLASEEAQAAACQQTNAAASDDDVSDASDVMTTAEVARYLRIGESTVLDYARRKIIPGKKIGKHWRFSRDDIVAYFNGLG